MESLRELFLGHNLNPFADSFQKAENSVTTKKKNKTTKSQTQCLLYIRVLEVSRGLRQAKGPILESLYSIFGYCEDT